jgi:hypothetical protein
MADGFDRRAAPGRHTHRAAQLRPAPPWAAQAAATRPGRGRPGLRRVVTAALVMLTLQYGLGMILNFYVEVPAADAHAGIVTEITTAPLALTAHALLGVALVGTAILAVARAMALRDRFLAVLAAAGLAAIVGAFVAGEMFVKNGQDSTSFAMAMLTGAALLSYVALLAVTTRTRPALEQETEPLLVPVPAARPEDVEDYPDDGWGAEPGWDDDPDWAGRLRQDTEAGWPGHPGWAEQQAEQRAERQAEQRAEQRPDWPQRPAAHPPVRPQYRPQAPQPQRPQPQRSQPQRPQPQRSQPQGPRAQRSQAQRSQPQRPQAQGSQPQGPPDWWERS